MALQQLRDRFHQPGIINYMKMEDCLWKSKNEAFDELMSDYPDVTISRLRVQLGPFQMQYKFGTVDEAAAVLSDLLKECKALFNQVEVLVQLLLLVPLQSAVTLRFDAFRYDCAARCLKIGLTMCVCSTSILKFLTR